MGTVLEIGSAHGRDAAFVESLGRTVRRTDATRAFVAMLREQGHEADRLDVLTDPLTGPTHGPYAAVLADAVFLHLSEQQLVHVLAKVRGSLVAGGLLAFTVKVGEGTEWSDHKLGLPRFFQYWQADPLRRTVEAAGFSPVEVVVDTGGTWDWLLVTARADEVAPPNG